MTRVEPSTGTCPQCGTPVIDAVYQDTRIRLTATPDPAGAYVAWNTATSRGWIAGDAHDDGHFRGMRRRVHACPDHQLDLSSEAQPGPTTANKQESP